MVPATARTPQGPTLREAVEAFVSCPRCANPHTRRAYTAVLDQALDHLSADRPLAELTGEQLAELFAEAWSDAGPATWNRNRAAVSSWLAWCVNNGWSAPVLPPTLRRREHTEPSSTPVTPVMFVVLLALHAGERHGYALIADVARLTGDTVTPGSGTVYPILQRMRAEGLVEELDASELPVHRGDRRAQRRRSYRITGQGRTAATLEARRLAVLVETATTLGVLTGRKPQEG